MATEDASSGKTEFRTLTPNDVDSVESTDQIDCDRRDGFIPCTVNHVTGSMGTEQGYVDCVEERFRVDRRKLEQLIQVIDDGSDENAEDFFAKIMKQTNTVIAWPSKLKIGAKSKKDPHIKVSGTQQAVTDAKERILSILNTKNSRVTVKLEVAYTEHSHVIGKGGNNIKRVMHETSCHIHFPDSNRNSQVEKSNQVSIAGPCSGVEDARQRIRELQPLVFMFDLPTFPSTLSPAEISRLSVVQHVQQTYGVSVTVRQHQRGGVPAYLPCTVIVRGSVYDAKAVKEATSLLFEHLTNGCGMPLVVTLALDIAPQHHQLIVGQGGATIKQIMQKSGASVQFPNPNISESMQRGTIYISGSMASVCLARQQLLGYVPLVLMFDIDEDVKINPDRLSVLMNQLHVYISIKPKPKQPSKSVIIKSMERNVENMYEARRLVSEGQNGTASSPVSTRNNSSPDFDALEPVSSAPPASMYSSPSIVTVPVAVYRPIIMQSSSPHGPPMSCVPQPYGRPFVHPSHPSMMRPPPSQPNTVFWSCRPPTFSMPSPTSHTADQTQPPQVRLPAPMSLPMPTSNHMQLGSSVSPLTPPPMTLGSHVESPTVEELASQLVASLPPDVVKSLLNSDGNQQEIDALVSTLNLLSTGTVPSKPSLLDGVDLKTNYTPSILSVLESFTNLSGSIPDSVGFLEPSQWQSMNPAGSVSGTNSGNDIFSYSLGFSERQDSGVLKDDNSASYGDGMMALGLLGSTDSSSVGQHVLPPHHSPISQADVNHSPTSEAASNQSKAPGNNRPNPDIKYRGASGGCAAAFTDFDYEQMKLMANRAIHTKPGGESRVPTDLWAGCGFSKSTPEADLRLRLNHSIARRPVIPTTYESREPEMDSSDPWKDVFSPLDGSTLDGGVSDLVTQMTANSSGLSDTSILKMRQQYGEESDRKVYDECQLGAVGGSMTSAGSLGRTVGGAVGGAECPAMGEDTVRRMWPLGRDAAAAAALQDEPEDLAELFSRLGLGKYTDIFQQQEIDLVTFLTLTEQDLKELGISTFGARRKMLNAITDMNKRQTLLQAVPRLPSAFCDVGGRTSRRHDLASQSGRW